MRIARLTILLLVGCTLAACDAPAPKSILSKRCLTIGAGEPVQLEIAAPADGPVRIGVEPRGIAVFASIESPSGMTARATSPVERLGLVTLVASGSANARLRLRVESRDWREIRGQVCVDAQLLRRSDVGRLRAERAFARAGSATAERDWARAFEEYERAARGFESFGLDALEGAARHAMAELAYMRLHRESDALALADAASRAYGIKLDPAIRGALAALQARAAIEVRSVSTPGEREALQSMIDTARSAISGSPAAARERLRLLILEGFLAYRTNSPERAEELFTRAMQDCAAASDWECHGLAAQNVALLAEERASFATALEIYSAARSRADPEVAPELAAGLHDNLGRLQRAAGLVSESEASHAIALRLYGQLSDCDGVRRTLARIGTLHAQVGSFDDALVELERAASLSCAELIEEAREGPETGFPAEASDPVSCDALTREELSSEGKSAVLQAVLALVDALTLSGDLNAAGTCAARAPAFIETSRGRVRTANARGQVLLEAVRSAEARAAYEEALRIADEANLPANYEHRGRTLLGLSRARLLQGDPSASTAIAVKALRASAARADLSQTIDSLRLLASGLRMRNETEVATRTLRTAVDLTERVPIEELDGDVRATYLAAQHAVFAELTGLLAAGARDEEAIWRVFEIAETGRARSLRYALNQSAKQRGQSGSWSDAVHVVLLHRLSKALNDAADEDLDSLLQRLQPLSEKSASAFGIADRRALQAHLGRLNATLVQYAAGDSGMFAFVVDSTQIRLVDLAERATITAAAERLVQSLGALEVSVDDVTSSARDVARLVWWPIAESIRDSRVLIAPDDTLHVIPFAMLPWSEARGDRLLVHEVESVTVPSASFIADQPPARKTAGSRGIALIGDPVFRLSEWNQDCRAVSHAREAKTAATGDWTEWLPSLPASRSEVLGIAEIARDARPAANIDVHLGCAATAGAVRLAVRDRRAVLHIATHGRVDARRPRLSSLVLAPEHGELLDPTFGLLDILELDLSARLVTLSACDTSRGRLLQGEGVLGPAQAFLQAGARSVLASHWRVEDAATAEFMKAFYARMLDHNMSASSALRLTQLEKQSSGGSYTWAAFALYGDPDTRI